MHINCIFSSIIHQLDAKFGIENETLKSFCNIFFPTPNENGNLNILFKYSPWTNYMWHIKCIVIMHDQLKISKYLQFIFGKKLKILHKKFVNMKVCKILLNYWNYCNFLFFYYYYFVCHYLHVNLCTTISGNYAENLLCFVSFDFASNFIIYS